MEFRPLASSSAGCCYICSSPGSPPLLIDAGLRFAEIQEALDFKTSELAGVLLSHAHGDHVKAVPELLKAGVDCYASRETWERVGLQHHRARWFTKDAFNTDECNRATGWIVKPFDVVHDMPTVGFMIEAPDGERLVYVTDTPYSPVRFAQITVFAVEANFSREGIRANAIGGRIDTHRAARTIGSHMSIETCEELLAANDLSQCREIWLLHLSDENSSEHEFKTRIQRRFGIPVYVAQKKQ